MLHRALSGLLAMTALAAAGLLSAGCSKSSSTGPSGNGGGGVVTVAGKVIGINGQSVAGVPVLVTGKPSTNTDANGAFSIAGVTTPYDITVVDAANKRAIVYKGLSRSDPTLTFLRRPSPAPSATGRSTAKSPAERSRPTRGQTTSQKSSLPPPKQILPQHRDQRALRPAQSHVVRSHRHDGKSLRAPVHRRRQRASRCVRVQGIREGSRHCRERRQHAQQPVCHAPGSFHLAVHGDGHRPLRLYTALKSLSVGIAGTALIPLFSDNTANAALSYYTPGISGASLLLEVYRPEIGDPGRLFQAGHRHRRNRRSHHDDCRAGIEPPGQRRDRR